MTRHLLRLIWNRKRHNLLLSIEVFFSFIVVLVVVAVSLNVLNNWRQPLGYRTDDIWRLEIRHGRLDADDREPNPARVNAIVTALRALPGIEAIAAVNIPPYAGYDWGTRTTDGLYVGVNAASDEFAALMGMSLVDGRWFTVDDDSATTERPVVVNARLARALFGDGAAIGQLFPGRNVPLPDGTLPPKQRIVGVFEEFRKWGELGTAQPYMFTRINMRRAGLAGEFFPERLVLRVAPGTTAGFEETILTTLRPLVRDWTFDVAPLARDRQAAFSEYLTILMIPAVLGVFMMLMVALGLTGVVWQNVTERTREFGLRRAKGAAARDVRRQVVVELLLVASLAIVPAALLIAQIPALPLPNDEWVIPDGLFLVSVAVSALTIYGVVLACAWYPSRLATRIQPAEALHYE